MTTGKLDLDSLLLSHGAISDSDSDDPTTSSFPLRTVDDILNDSDSDSSDSDSSPNPPILLPPLKPTQPQDVRSPPKTLEKGKQEQEDADDDNEPSGSSFTWRRSRSRDHLLGFRPPPPPPPARTLPPLFGSVRPNLKPGAALAAAAAASRSIPTPHAAAIKSRRANSAGFIQKVDSVADSQDLEEEFQELEREIEEDQLSVFNSSINNDAAADDKVEVSSSSPHSSSEEEVVREEVEVSVEERDTSELVEANEETVIDSDSLPSDEIAHTVDGNDENARQVDDDLPVQDKQTGEVDMRNEEVELGYDSDKEASNEREVRGEIEDEGNSGDEIDKLVEERLEQLENSKKAEKKLRASMKLLELAEELEKRQASYGQHWEEGAAAQPMRLEGIRRGPPAVGHLQIDLDNAVTRTISSHKFKRDYGSPLVVAVHMNFVSLGTTKGVVLVFPSKYSAHSADHMDTKILTFVSHGAKSQIPVTSMCFNQLGELLLVGYGDGSLTVWDVQKAAIAKVITGEHTSPIVHTLFLGQFKAVSGDSKGLVFLHTISVVPLLNRFSVKSQCLLDGQKNGVVLSANPLLIDDSNGIGYVSTQVNPTAPTSGLSSMVGGVVGGEAGWKLFNEGSSLLEEGVVIFVTHLNALVVRLTPNVEIYDKFNKPDGVREGSMPYTAWKCTSNAHDSSLDASEKSLWLLIAWDRRVQIKQLVKSKIKDYREWSLDSTAIGVAWLDDQMLVVLTLRGQLCLYTKDGTEINRTSFVLEGSGLDDIVSYHTHFTNTFGNPEKAYHNSVTVRGATIYILGPMYLLISRLLPWKERIQVLQRAGDWMGALDMAMRLYDGRAQGVIDLPKTVDAIRDTIMPYLVELLLSYVDEVFSYISVAFCNQIGKLEQLEDPNFTDSSVRSEIEEQYARVGGVAVEFCVHIKRTDILFDAIFSKFVAVKHEGTFLEILEPYILRDMLGCLPPEIMQALVEHYSTKGWLQRVEQCVLHMDISSLDFNQVVKLCREHGLYGALIYLFSSGLNDFTTPLEELLFAIQNSLSTDVTAIGYRMLVYLKYCFEGLAFPPGHGSLPPSRLPSVRNELVQFLLKDSKSVRSEVTKRFESWNGNCPNLCSLLWLDTEATLNVLSHAFPEEEHTDANLETPEAYIENHKLIVQSTVNVLISILDLDSDVFRSFTTDTTPEVWPSKKDLGQLLEFVAKLVTVNGATISGRVLKHILEYLTSHGPSKNVDTVKKEKQVLSLLKAVPQTEWDSSHVLHLCTEAHFYQACGLIHTVNGKYIDALDSYMNDVDDPIHAFSFISNMLLQLKDTEASSFRFAVLSRVPQLVKLSRECTFFLVIDHLSSESQNILSNLHFHRESLFLFLKTAVDVHLSGTLNLSVLEKAHISNTPTGRMREMPKEIEAYVERFSNFPKPLLQNMVQITDEIAELYLELLCRYERESVFKFLDTFENYRLEHCLHVCLDNGVTDAAAFLMERAGDVGSALKLVMGDLSDKISMLVTAVDNKFSGTTSTFSAETDQFASILKMTEVVCVHDVLHASIGLCQRNTRRLDQQESETLWFELFESFSKQLMGFYRNTELPSGTSSTISGIQQKFSKSFNILRSLFAKFVGEIIEGMVGYIPLPSIMEKLLSDNGNQEFGDFKLTILKMLGTYGYEKKILDTAKSLIEDDTFSSVGLLKKRTTHAFVPQDSVCCICGCSLSKGSSTFKIHVFSCGHSTHLHCESEENEQSKSYPERSNSYPSVGCPICLPKKNTRAKSKSMHMESGLVATSTSNSEPFQGLASVQQAHEPDLEKPYGLQQMSRFEILNSLQKPHKPLQIDPPPQLRLSPPAIYHEKVQIGTGPLVGETSNTVMKNEKSSRKWQLRELKSKGALNRFPLKSNFSGPEKNKVR